MSCGNGRVLCLLVSLANWSQALKLESDFFFQFQMSIYKTFFGQLVIGQLDKLFI